ncbi:putative FCH domain only protein 2 isoform 2, partial [Scophthalmus maximus]
FYTQEEIRRDQGKGNYGKIVDERLRTVSGGFIPIYTDVSKKLEDGTQRGIEENEMADPTVFVAFSSTEAKALKVTYYAKIPFSVFVNINVSAALVVYKSRFSPRRGINPAHYQIIVCDWTGKISAGGKSLPNGGDPHSPPLVSLPLYITHKINQRYHNTEDTRQTYTDAPILGSESHKCRSRVQRSNGTALLFEKTVTSGLPVCVLHDVYIFRRDTIVSHELPQQYVVYAVKCLFKVNEIDIDRGVPFYGLLEDDPEGGNLVTGRSSVPETSLVFSQSFISPLPQPLQDNAIEHFARDLVWPFCLATAQSLYAFFTSILVGGSQLTSSMSAAVRISTVWSASCLLSSSLMCSVHLFCCSSLTSAKISPFSFMVPIPCFLCLKGLLILGFWVFCSSSMLLYSLLSASRGIGPCFSPEPCWSALPASTSHDEDLGVHIPVASLNRCIVKITGDMTLSFPMGIIKVFTTNPSPAVLTFKLKNTSRLEQILPNKQLLYSDPSQSDSNSKDFWFNMQALTSYLRKASDQNPSASYFNVDILKYQVLSDGIHSTPLNLAVYWKSTASTTDLRVDYRYNPDSMVSPGPLSNVQILVPVDGGVTNMQSLPNSIW